jgi:hypothetical protein
MGYNRKSYIAEMFRAAGGLAASDGIKASEGLTAIDVAYLLNGQSLMPFKAGGAPTTMGP